MPSGLEQGVERIQKRFGVVCCAAFVLHDIFMRGMPQQDIAAGRASRIEKLDHTGAMAIAEILKLMLRLFQGGYGQNGFGRAMRTLGSRWMVTVC